MQHQGLQYYGIAGQRYHELVNSALKVALVAHLIVLPTFWLMGAHLLAQYNILSVLVFGFCIWLRKRGYIYPVIILAYSEVITHAVLASWQLGLDAGYQFYVSALAMLVLMNMSDRLFIKVFKMALLVITYLMIIVVFQEQEPVIRLSELHTLVLYNGNQIALMLIVAYLIYFYSKVVQVSEDRLYSMATRDQLTGLYNRRYIDDFAANFFSNPSRKHKHLSMLLIDADHFKAVNDTYGHGIGDQVLIAISESLNRCVRIEDVVGRWGGEEFIILLPDTDLKAAAEIAARIISTVADTTVETGEEFIQVTVSVGVVEKNNQMNFDQLTLCADKALYDAKSAGRNGYATY